VLGRPLNGLLQGMIGRTGRLKVAQSAGCLDAKWNVKISPETALLRKKAPVEPGLWRETDADDRPRLSDEEDVFDILQLENRRGGPL
jgi:hypothetical protein